MLCHFLWFFGVLSDILCINWVFNAFMCIIQIWTTCTCSSAPKLVKKITCVSLGEFVGPMQEMGMNFKHQGTVDSWQNVEVLAFVILVHPKDVWNSWTLACYHGMASTCWGKKYCPIWGRLWYKLLTNQGISQESLMVPLGKRVTFVDKTPLLYFNFFPGVNIEL